MKLSKYKTISSCFQQNVYTKSILWNSSQKYRVSAKNLPCFIYSSRYNKWNLLLYLHDHIFEKVDYKVYCLWLVCFDICTIAGLVHIQTIIMLFPRPWKHIGYNGSYYCSKHVHRFHGVTLTPNPKAVSIDRPANVEYRLAWKHT